MITILSLSPAIDKRLEFDGFRLGGTNRIQSAHTEGAGKGIDVALAARALGIPARCIGILAGGGAPVTERLDRNGAAHDFLPTPGTVRVNQKLYDRTNGVITEVSEPSPEAPRDVLQRAFKAALAAAGESRFLVLTGSLPQGCPPGWYADLIRSVRGGAPSCRVVLDADGERLSLGMRARPWLVKPNRAELEQAHGKPLRAKEDILAAARALCEGGPDVVVVSMGGEGAMAVSRTEAVFAPALKEPIRTTTGAGDAMVGGLLKGFVESDSLENALRHGVASATARCVYGGDAFIDAALYAEYAPKVNVLTIG